MANLSLDGWAIVLGASSGFGEITAKTLAKYGMNIIGVHLDRRATMPKVEEIKQAIQSEGREAWFYNINAADDAKRQEVVADVQKRFQEKGIKQPVRVLMHSLAFGTLKPYWEGAPGEDPKANILSRANFEMTSDVMAHSLVYWSQEILKAGLFGKNSRIYAMTSEGGSRVWAGYGAVSAAKCALESHCRQLAAELAPYGISANAICAGVTDTPALRKIPGNEEMIAHATKRNPHKRLTTPQDVADAIAVLSLPQAQWITGNIIYADGGEFIAG